MRAPEHRSGVAGEGCKLDPRRFPPHVASPGALAAANAPGVTLSAPSTLNQHDSEGCTGHAVIVCLFALFAWLGSPRMAWALARLLGAPGTILTNEGASLWQAIAALTTWGSLPMGPMVDGSDVTDANMNAPPTQDELIALDAMKFVGATTIISTGAQRVTELRAALDAGSPVACAVYVDAAFDAYGANPSTPLGAVDAATIRGVHAVACIGYRVNADGTIVFIFRNSWGANWGLAGNFEGSEAFVSTMLELHPMAMRRVS